MISKIPTDKTECRLVERLGLRVIASLTRSTFPSVLAVLAGLGGLVFNNEPVVLSALTHLRMELRFDTLP